MERNTKGRKMSIRFHNAVSQCEATMSELKHHDAVAQPTQKLIKAISSPQLRSGGMTHRVLKPFPSHSSLPTCIEEEKQEQSETQQ